MDEWFVWGGEAFCLKRARAQASDHGRVVHVTNKAIVFSSGKVFAIKMDLAQKTATQTAGVLIDFKQCISCCCYCCDDDGLLFLTGPELPPCTFHVKTGLVSTKQHLPLENDAPTCCCYSPTMQSFLIGLESGKVLELNRNGEEYAMLFDLQSAVVFISEQACAVAVNGRARFGDQEFQLPGPVLTACALEAVGLVHCTRNGCAYFTPMGTAQSSQLRLKQGRVLRVLGGLGQTRVLLVFANGETLCKDMSELSKARGERTLKQLLVELNKCETETGVDYSALELRILSINQSFAIQHSRTPSTLRLRSKSPDYLFEFTPSFPLLVPNATAFCIEFEQGVWKEAITVHATSVGRGVCFRVPEPDCAMREPLLPLDVSVTIICPLARFAHRLVWKQRFDCIDTGELHFPSQPRVAAATTVRTSFQVFSVERKYLSESARVRGGLELLRALFPKEGWDFLEQGAFRASADCIGEVRIRLEFDGERLEMTGVCRGEICAAVLREALRRRCKPWFTSEYASQESSSLAAVASMDLTTQRLIYDADRALREAEAAGGEAAAERIRNVRKAWRLARHIVL